jgi:hypothetical protein
MENGYIMVERRRNSDNESLEKSILRMLWEEPFGLECAWI